MRFLRVRFGISTLLCVVAVAAMNLAVLKPLFEPDYAYGNADSEGSIILAGFLPLISVALIGCLRFVRRTSQTAFGRRELSRTAPAAFTYFSLHFLALGSLIAAFMSEEIEQSLTAMVDQVLCASGVPMDIPLPDWGVYWGVLFELLITAFLISAPLLAFSGIGAALAHRYAACVSLRRFRTMAWAVTFCFSAVGLSIAITPRAFDGEVGVTAEYEVVDRDTGQPVVGALVSMTDAFSSRMPWASSFAITDSDGRACLRGRLPAHGQSNAFRITGMFSSWGQWLTVSAPGCPTTRMALPAVLGSTGLIGNSVFRRIVVAKGHQSQEPLVCVAGIYSLSGGMGGTSVELLPDGHFVWSSAGCRHYDRGYGTFTNDGDLIRFHSIPPPGEEAHWLLAEDYRLIKWGDRTYLALAVHQNLVNLCRSAVLPKRYSSYVLLRQEDQGRAQFGLPHLPLMIWLKFLGSEMGAMNVLSHFAHRRTGSLAAQ
jgi:hypothetical protein